ncbi:phospholysine phosphohistidine inorganic pyrophosphate phosphatase-like isoform X2 [Penaeus japonicus]|uniref:phospholysine phosphohistidine inorganic pyrophosphate phosphatase-like isoform X2 n=1 Tax=Penaeus japonicus TaxID=27405 RepID=UPI001C711626|nr:phospholysine phosphohistidine inorganic pyrophosphate phosphatase-like isoform X2 [Penaeus japonicus]
MILILLEEQQVIFHRWNNIPPSRTMSSWLDRPIKGVLLDITGVLYESGDGKGVVIPGSVKAVEKLKTSGIPVRLVTNETCATRTAVVDKLRFHGYKVSEADIFSPVPAAIAILKERGLSPHLLVHPAIEDEFKEVIKGSPSCVVVGDADEGFSFENMNKAFRTLLNMEKPLLFALGFGKYYKHQGMLQMDVGAFASALEFACDLKSEVVGKPSRQFFGAALSDIGVPAEEAVMVGDDIVSDVGGAQNCGIRGVLVRTGKFTAPWENHPVVKPDFIANNLAEAVDKIIEAQKK